MSIHQLLAQEIDVTPDICLGIYDFCAAKEDETPKVLEEKDYYDVFNSFYSQCQYPPDEILMMKEDYYNPENILNKKLDYYSGKIYQERVLKEGQ